MKVLVAGEVDSVAVNTVGSSAPLLTSPGEALAFEQQKKLLLLLMKL